MTEGFLNNHAPPIVVLLAHQTRSGKLFDDGTKEIWRSGEIKEVIAVRGVFFVEGFELGFDLGINVLVVEIAGHVVQALGKPIPDLRIDVLAGVVLNVLGKAFAEFVIRHRVVSNAEDSELVRQQVDFREVVESGNQLALGQIARGAEHHHDAGIAGTSRGALLRAGKHVSLCHLRVLHQAVLDVITGSTWPPNFCRIADNIFSANVCSSRERKRTNKAADRTSTGTASSMAASIVQRPSPESCTKPEYSDKVGFSTSAIAVKSRSQELITLPRRQTSEMSARFRSYCCSLGSSGLFALRKMSKPSAY